MPRRSNPRSNIDRLGADHYRKLDETDGVYVNAQIPALYATDGVPLQDKVALIKFFDPTGRGTWYVFEGSREGNATSNVTYFGFVVSPLGSDCDELGYFSLDELLSVRGRLGLGIERDIHFKPTKFSEVPR